VTNVAGNDEREVYEGQIAWFHMRYAEKGPEALNVELLWMFV
jgi:hypothetical protein